MNLQQAADEAMAYLDSVGVAADYDIRMYNFSIGNLSVFTDEYIIGIPSSAAHDSFILFMDKIKEQYPQKSPS